MNAIENDEEALTQALVLAITAPTRRQSEAATKLAEEFAARLSPETVAACQSEASKRVARTPADN